jgi:putative transposase
MPWPVARGPRRAREIKGDRLLFCDMIQGITRKGGSSMPRIARGISDGAVYHLLNRGNARQQVFHRDDDYQAFVHLLRETDQRNPLGILAYCLMPNHFHLVVQPEKADNLHRGMQWLMTSHVRRQHALDRGSGHIWQGRYKSFLIEQDSHLLVVLRYVEGNPLRAGLVSSAIDWPWSSHLQRVGAARAIFVKDLPIEYPTPWTSYVNRPFSEGELAGLHQSVARQSPYGNPDWQMEIGKQLGLESTMRPRGRPRKQLE